MRTKITGGESVESGTLREKRVVDRGNRRGGRRGREGMVHAAASKAI